MELGVIRTFEFVSALRRMSVVVKRLKSTSMEIYVKGAPEVMAEICEKDSCKSSLLSLFEDLILHFLGYTARFPELAKCDKRKRSVESQNTKAR